MAISLQAEQKNIYKLFSDNQLRYKIPPYQRPYSWGIEQCEELLQDLERVYNTNKEDGYFLGNLVLALDSSNRTEHEIIDGQQRIITLTLLLKALLAYDTENKNLKNCLWQINSRTDDIEFPRVLSLVSENNDDTNLRDILNIELPIKFTDSCNSKLYNNLQYFYEQLKRFDDNNDIEKFSDFLLYNISLLPILTEDSDLDKAREKALVIFETINDRGISLSDSDIFKAKLYSIALNKNCEESFIEKWQELDENCKNIGIKIDDIFRAYTHVVRGENGIKGFETSLREFYTSSSYSPIKKKTIEQILEDLFKIYDSISFFKEVVKNVDINNKLSKWFQLIDIYTNQYPYMALVVYLFKTQQRDDDDLLDIAKNLVKFAYTIGSTSRIKHDIYPIIISIMHGDKFSFNEPSYSSESFIFVGTMRKPYVLLSFYLEERSKAIYPYYIDRVLLLRDKERLNETWNKDFLDEAIETLGNYCVSDIQRKNQILPTRLQALKKTKISGLKEFLETVSDWNYQEYEQRNERSIQRIVDFIRD